MLHLKAYAPTRKEYSQKPFYVCEPFSALIIETSGIHMLRTHFQIHPKYRDTCMGIIHFPSKTKSIIILVLDGGL